MTTPREERIKELKNTLSELRSQLPAHSIKPEMIMKIEELEEELERLKNESGNVNENVNGT